MDANLFNICTESRIQFRLATDVQLKYLLNGILHLGIYEIRQARETVGEHAAFRLFEPLHLGSIHHIFKLYNFSYTKKMHFNKILSFKITKIRKTSNVYSSNNNNNLLITLGIIISMP